MKKIIEAMKVIQQEIKALKEKDITIISVGLGFRDYVHVFHSGIDKVAEEFGALVKYGGHSNESDRKHFEVGDIEIFELVERREPDATSKD